MSRPRAAGCTAHRGLELLVRLKEQEKIRRYRGELRWRGDLDKSRET